MRYIVRVEKPRAFNQIEWAYLGPNSHPYPLMSSAKRHKNKSDAVKQAEKSGMEYTIIED